MKARSFLLGIVGASLLMGGALAQNTPMMQGRGPWAQQWGGAMMGGGMMGGMACAGHSEGMAAFYKAELGITAAQESVWAPFADALRKQMQDMANHPMMGRGTGDGGAMGPGMMWRQGDDDADNDAKISAMPDALDAHIKWAEAHLAGMKALSAAAKPLYKALSDDQKAKADRLLGGPMCRF